MAVNTRAVRTVSVHVLCREIFFSTPLLHKHTEQSFLWTAPPLCEHSFIYSPGHYKCPDSPDIQRDITITPHTPTHQLWNIFINFFIFTTSECENKCVCISDAHSKAILHEMQLIFKCYPSARTVIIDFTLVKLFLNVRVGIIMQLPDELCLCNVW